MRNAHLEPSFLIGHDVDLKVRMRAESQSEEVAEQTVAEKTRSLEWVVENDANERAWGGLPIS